MGLWLNALEIAAAGTLAAARELVRCELPLVLRTFAVTEEGTRTYSGPVMAAVRRFMAQRSTAERALISRYDCELVDTIVDDVVAAVERSLEMVAIVRAEPDADLRGLVALVPWASGLKRDQGWKRSWLADALRSMVEAGIPLAGHAVSEAECVGSGRFRFDEVAFAADPRRIELTWRDLRQRQQLGTLLSIVDDEADLSVSAEAADYAAVRMADVALRVYAPVDFELSLDLRRIAARLSCELTDLLESMHSQRPEDGYRPIAWHNVFWAIGSDYEPLGLELDTRDPFMETDERLGTHLRTAYPEVKSTSRPVILRRRRGLYDACDERIVLAIRNTVAMS